MENNKDNTIAAVKGPLSHYTHPRLTVFMHTPHTLGIGKPMKEVDG